MAFTIIAAVIWSIFVTRRHKEKVNSLNHGDNIKVETTMDATYMYRIDTNTHRVKIGHSAHDVNFRDIVIGLMLLLSIQTVQAQYVCLEWSRAEVKREYRNLPVLFQAKDYIEYKTETGWQSYEFTRIGRTWICTQAQTCMSQADADSLISKHRDNWVPVSPNRCEYHTGIYDKPVQVEADRYGDNVVFRYWME